MRRAPHLELVPLLGALADEPGDEITGRILDAAAGVLADSGLRRCTVEEIAERARVGRTSLYRRFDGRDEIVQAVLARELRSFLAAISGSVAHIEALGDRVVEGFLGGLRSAHGSLLVHLARTEPDLLLFLVTDAGPMTQVATDLLVAELRRERPEVHPERARHGAEVLFRLAVSFALMPDTALPLDDEDAARTALHELFDPLLGSLMR